MGRVGCLAIALWALGSIWPVSAATAGQQSPSADSTSSESASASPVAPAVITRTTEGQATVRAVRVTRPPTLDGRLDDSVYTGTLPIDGFIQQEPQEGAPASEKTEAWMLFDDSNIYVAARCWDSHPERDVLSELRRDNNNIIQNENFTVVFDTFHDRRNGFFFQTNAARRGPRPGDRRRCAQHELERRVGCARRAGSRRAGRWRWSSRSSRSATSAPGPQIWGVNFRRIVKWKNEYSYLTAMPASFGTGQAIGRMGSAGTLVGLETPGSSKNLEIKPYAVSSLTTDNTARPAFENDPDGDVGFDFKYGLTRSLIADVTVNTDFAQVEEDLQQVNLTRFSLFFPEKRDFFLEGQGIFAFGGVGFNNGGGSPGDVPIMFFSRRIGLENGQSVPVIAGGRLTGRAGRYSIGAVNIETDDKLSAAAVQTNFTAVRVKRDVLRRSNIGLVATMRSPSEGDSQCAHWGRHEPVSLRERVGKSVLCQDRYTGPRRRHEQLPGQDRPLARSLRHDRRAPGRRRTLRSTGGIRAANRFQAHGG